MSRMGCMIACRSSILTQTTMADLDMVGLVVVDGSQVSRTSIIHKESLSPGLIQMPIIGMAEDNVPMGPAYKPALSQPLQTTR